MRHNHIFFYVVFILILGFYIRESLIFNAIWLFEAVSSISQYVGLLLFLYLATFFIFYYRLLLRKTFFPLEIFKKLIIVTYILSVIWSVFVPFDSFSNYILLALPFLVLQFSYHMTINLKCLNLLFILNISLLALLLFTYFQFYEIILLSTGKEESVSNSSYFLLYLLPISLCTNKRIITIIAFISVFIAVAMSGKRGGTIAILLGLMVYLFIKYVFLKNIKNKTLSFLFLSIIIILLTYISIGMISDEDLFIIDRFEEMSDTGGSGRDVVWKKTYNMIINSDFPYLFFGHGYDQVVKDSTLRLSAHNDLLEIAYDFGIPIMIIYIVFNIQIMIRIIRMIKESSKYAAPFVFSYITFVINSMVSHIFIYTYHLIIYAYVWGTILGLYYLEKQKKQRDYII